jgi:hypothetical protein
MTCTLDQLRIAGGSGDLAWQRRHVRARRFHPIGENEKCSVFHLFTSGKIETVWSVIDQAAIKAQLSLWWKNVDPKDHSDQGPGNRLYR